MTSKILGRYEMVQFPEFKIGVVQAKIDTGAYTGALHCTKIREEKDENGKAVIHFSPFDHPEVEIIETSFTTSHVKSSNGKREKRYYINTQIRLQGKTYPIKLTLANRSEMRWPVLIGRRFLKLNNFLVDVTRSPKYGGDQKVSS